MMFDGEKDVSMKMAARKFHVGFRVIKRWLKELEIERKLKKKISLSNDKQKAKQKAILHKISRQEFKATNDHIDIVMDDETYIDMNGCDFSGNKYYYESGLLPVDESVKFRAKTKFPQKVLIWMAISCKGHSSVYFRAQKEGAINGQIYRDECIKKRLIPFIKKNYPEEDYLFWPDLASSHYSNTVLELLEKKKVKFLPKDRNPPNVSQVRPIETFWANLKRRMFEDGFKPNSVADLVKRAKQTIRSFDETYFERLMSSVGTKVRAAANRGPLSVIN